MEIPISHIDAYLISKLPHVGDLWGCFMDFDMKRMDAWERIIPTFKYYPEVPFFEMLVPTTDTVRFGYLLEKLLAVKQSVLYTGKNASAIFCIIVPSINLVVLGFKFETTKSTFQVTLVLVNLLLPKVCLLVLLMKQTQSPSL